MDRQTVLATVCAAVQSLLDDPQQPVHAGDHLVGDLGFDSMAMASLTIALEEAFDDVLLLADWIASASNPSELTIDSLVDYLIALRAEGA